ncbi:MAG: hypothetical protein LBH58_09310 [Tannerellaceae bacterium]|jgi:hypothetical protein|nr:hypothetical protein [Tannerellaceae bacterium]
MKKILFYYIFLLFLVSADIIAKNVWDGSIDESWPEDLTHTEFAISTPAQLARLAQLVNDSLFSFEDKRIILLNDIDLKNIPWEPIGRMEYSSHAPYHPDSKKSFRGHFDGNNKTIRNLSIEAKYPATGLFGYIENGAKIENLTLNKGKVYKSGAIVVDSAYTYCFLATAALVGYVYSNPRQTDSIIIRNCHNLNVEVNNSVTYSDYAGIRWDSYTSGLVGYVQNTVGYSEKSYCKSLFLLENCSNNAMVNGTYFTSGIIGGIMNTANFDTRYGKGDAVVVIRSCRNKGEIDQSGKITTQQVGGIVSRINNRGQFVFEDCINEGNINLHTDIGAIGGLIGEIYLENEQSVIKNSCNKGILTSGNEAKTGGIIGCANISYNGENGYNSLIMESCINTGEIDTYAESVTGGIIGSIYCFQDIENVEQQMNGSIKLSNCYASSKIYQSTGVVGGLVGELQKNVSYPFPATKIMISNNYVAYDFEIENDAIIGGLIGKIDLGKADDSYNIIPFAENVSTHIKNNLVTLTDMPELYSSYRIAGILKTNKYDKAPLFENYAYVENRSFTNEIKHYKQNGEDWKGTMNFMPLSVWNDGGETVWDFDPTDCFMPKLANVSFEQPDIPNPMHNKSSVGIFPVVERPFTCTAAGSGLYFDTNTPGDLYIYKFSGSLHNKRYIPAGLTTIQLPRDLYIVNFNGFSEKIMINR